MGSQRGSGGMSSAQTKVAQLAYSSPRPVEQRASLVSPSSLIKKKVTPDTNKPGSQKETNH
jgi:hypothetical protein